MMMNRRSKSGSVVKTAARFSASSKNCAVFRLLYAPVGGGPSEWRPLPLPSRFQRLLMSFSRKIVYAQDARVVRPRRGDYAERCTLAASEYEPVLSVTNSM